MAVPLGPKGNSDIDTETLSSLKLTLALPSWRLEESSGVSQRRMFHDTAPVAALGWTVPAKIMALACTRVGRLLEQALPTAAYPNSQGSSLLIFTSRIKSGLFSSGLSL